MNHEKLDLLLRELLAGAVPDCLPDALNEVVAHMGRLLSTPDSPTADQTQRALGALINARLHSSARDLAQNWAVTHGFDPVVEKRLVQALVELGQLDGAETCLAAAIAQASSMNTPQARRELTEYQGQLGRIAKQRFVQTDNLDELARSIDIYAARYRDNGKPYFHGVNLVALVAAQARLNADLEIAADLRLPGLAETVLTDVLEKMAAGDASQWSLVTASEACLALHRCDEAELWLHRFLQHPQTQPFHIESYSRQLRDIWSGNALRNSLCADRLSAVIDRHVMRTQQRWSMSPNMLRTLQDDPQSLERNFSGERTFAVNTIKRMLEKCTGIGCVTDAQGRRLGTGFLMEADSLALGAPGELVFVTNSHVISHGVQGAIAPDEAWVSFELECAAKGQPVSHKVLSPVLFSSPPGSPGVTANDRLDVTVVKLQSWPDGGVALRTSDSLPTPSRKTKVFVVGHPSGDALQLSLHDSELLDVCDEERLLHYRTPTEPGSSGSPVFNMNWEVVAIHHAGSPAMPRLRGKGHYEANEGISLRAIRGAAMTRS